MIRLLGLFGVPFCVWSLGPARGGSVKRGLVSSSPPAKRSVFSCQGSASRHGAPLGHRGHVSRLIIIFTAILIPFVGIILDPWFMSLERRIDRLRSQERFS